MLTQFYILYKTNNKWSKPFDRRKKILKEKRRSSMAGLPRLLIVITTGYQLVYYGVYSLKYVQSFQATFVLQPQSSLYQIILAAFYIINII